MIQQKMKLHGKIIQEVTYNIDEWGFRRSLILKNKIEKLKHWVLAGDSQVFGEWCSDTETLDANLNKLLPSYSIHNWGRRGGGPHNTLAWMQNFDYKKFIRQKQGVFSYTFFPYYMYERVIGSKNYVSWDHGTSPYYKLGKDGRLLYQGSFNDRYFFTSLFKYISGNSILNKLFPDLPMVSKEDVLLVASIFKEMKNIYSHDFPQGKFVVIINNSMGESDKWRSKLLVRNLKNEGMEVEIIPYGDAYSVHHFVDGHIDAKGQDMQASAYYQLIKKYL